MGKITALRESKRRGHRLSLFLDGRFAFSLEPDIVASEGLRVGDVLSDDDIEALQKTDHFQRCYSAALHFISYRPRSETEIRERLLRRGFAENDIATAIGRLKEGGLISDEAFARFWTESRETFRPRSRFLTSLELRRKGVADEIVTEVTAEIDDEGSAYQAAQKKLRSLAGVDYESFRRRLGDYLKRRGFGYGVISHTVNRVWHECQESRESQV